MTLLVAVLLSLFGPASGRAQPPSPIPVDAFGQEDDITVLTVMLLPCGVPAWTNEGS
ncbi:MAG TPA: hypothetical protein VIY53_21220 [Acidobacteriaceae bacterium]